MYTVAFSIDIKPAHLMCSGLISYKHKLKKKENGGVLCRPTQESPWEDI